MPKVKTKRAAAKRFKKTGTGELTNLSSPFFEILFSVKILFIVNFS